MLLKPCKRNLLVKFFQPPTTLLATPRVLEASADSRTRVKVIAAADEVIHDFPVGSFLLLRPNPAILVISEPLALGLIDASVIEAIVLDDSEI